MRGTGQLSMQHSEQTKVVLHLGQAIDAQTKGNESQAAEELEHALEAGFNHPALYFDLGLLRLKETGSSRPCGICSMPSNTRTSAWPRVC